MLFEIIIITFISILVGLYIDYRLFCWWHKIEHSNELMQKEKERIKKEVVNNGK